MAKRLSFRRVRCCASLRIFRTRPGPSKILWMWTYSIRRARTGSTRPTTTCAARQSADCCGLTNPYLPTPICNATFTCGRVSSQRGILMNATKLCLIFALALSAPAVYAQQKHAVPKAEVLPTGVEITPTAAPGAMFETLNPGLADFPDFVAGQAVSTATSPDGKTLLILTSGYNLMNNAKGETDKASSSDYVFVYDISTGKPQKKQALQIPNSYMG